MTNSPMERVVDMADYLSHRSRLTSRIAHMTPAELELLLAFTDQIVRCFDPDAVRDFLSLREDERLGSILQIAAALSEEGREQLLFTAEQYYVEER